jgi:hypothetical protein
MIVQSLSYSSIDSGCRFSSTRLLLCHDLTVLILSRMITQSSSLQWPLTSSTVPQRSYPFSRLPPYAIPCKEYRTLWCPIKGDREPFKVVPPLNVDVDDLREAIHAKGIDTKSAVLPKEPCYLKGVDVVGTIITIVADPFVVAEGIRTLGTQRKFRPPC